MNSIDNNSSEKKIITRLIIFQQVEAVQFMRKEFNETYIMKRFNVRSRTAKNIKQKADKVLKPAKTKGISLTMKKMCDMKFSEVDADVYKFVTAFRRKNAVTHPTIAARAFFMQRKNFTRANSPR